MQALEIVQKQTNVITISKADLVSRAKLASTAARAGRCAILVAQSREEFSKLVQLATLFNADMSAQELDPQLPLWQLPVLTLPPGLLLRGEKPDWSVRLATLYGLSLAQPRVVVASAESLLLRYPPLDFFAHATLELSVGSELDTDALLAQLVQWGYNRVPMVTKAGEVTRRGDIVDIFAIGYQRPLRLEFFGDSLEEIRAFDAESQRSLQNLTQATIIPALPYLATETSINESCAYLHTLSEAGKIDENVAYDCRKALEHGSRALLPGVVHAKSTVLEQWLGTQALFFTDSQESSSEGLATTYQNLASLLNAVSMSIDQPASLCLRDLERAPWAASSVVYSEGIGSPQDIVCQERPLHSFQELFPDPSATDRPWQHLSSFIRTMAKEKKQVILSFSSNRGRKSFLKLAEQEGILPQLRYNPEQAGLYTLISGFRQGAELVWDNSLVLGEEILFPRANKSARTKGKAFKGLDSFEDLQEGQLLVHRDYGIGRFRGLKRIFAGGIDNDFLLIEYQGQDKLYVPVDRLGLVQRFKGAEGVSPSLDRLGGSAWQTSRDKVRKAIEKIAADLVEMYAYRKVAKGYSYPPLTDVYQEFAATFNYEETPDQAKAIEEVLHDMDKSIPMDRLICGDVGFGKTEVALRAAFRAASEGRQVVLLCPTTVLAEQHYQTFKSRMDGFAINVGLLSRFVTLEKQKQVIREVGVGQIDILIGTHRVLSSDVLVPNLGLLILDEEQRFGVRHKEAIKALKKNVDVLTLTATPIPRTLQLSMSGIRDLSIIETAPQERKPVETLLTERDDALLRAYVRRELEREGQVFWVYNRVQGLARVTEYVQGLVPEAKVGMVHGRMTESEVEKNMRAFWHGELDVLVCTSIVESGLDFPSANTIIIDQAQNYGLSQLYQLRGRVGRSDRQAYALFIVPDTKHMTPIAEERMRIIMDLDYLGAGFKIAMEDLRLRGAGNILGEAQSGHMARVGLDLYLEMLEQAVARIKGIEASTPIETELNIAVPARIPETYVTDASERLQLYRALTGVDSGQSREEVALAIRDRFGPYPEELNNFLAVLDFKQFLSSLQVEKADLSLKKVRLTWAKDQNAADPIKLLELPRKVLGAQLVPPATIVLPLANKDFCTALQELTVLLAQVKLEPKPQKSQKA